MESFEPLPDEKKLLTRVERMKKELGISDRSLGEPLGLPQTSIWKIFHEERNLMYYEAQGLVEFLLMVLSPIPYNKVVKDLAVKGKDLTWANSHDKIRDVAKLMFRNGFSQLPVRSENEAYLGVITEDALIKKMLTPEKGNERSWLKKLSDMTLLEADIIETLPKYEGNEPLRVVAQVMIHYPAILVEEEGKVTGILTRSDFMRLFI
ncbi:MAG: CBS domain-containing protein [Candidatus Methanomethylicaceae archaeon]|jgi:predicted transcriptional regulator